MVTGLVFLFGIVWRFGTGAALAAAAQVTRRAVNLRCVFFVGLFGNGEALAAAEFRFEGCCEDVSLAGHPRVGEALLLSTEPYFRALNACEGAPMNTSACCVSHSHKHYRTLGLRWHNCWAF